MKIQLGYKPENISNTGIDINALNKLVSKLPSKWDVQMQQLNDQINTTKQSKNNLSNKVYKGLNDKTSGTYYDSNGNLLFKNGKITEAGKQLFGKNSDRAEKNMQSGNIFQNNSWRADNTTFDFNTMKAKQGYENKYRKEKNGQWSFIGEDGSRYYFNMPIFNNKKAANKTEVKKSNSNYTTPEVKPVNTKWDLQGADTYNESWLAKLGILNDSEDYYRKLWLEANPKAQRSAPIASYLWNSIFSENNRDILPSYKAQFKQDYNKWKNKNYAKNVSQNTSWYWEDPGIVKAKTINGSKYIPLDMDSNYKGADGNYYDYYDDVIPNVLEDKHGNAWILSHKNGGKIRNTNNKFENWINGTK